MTPYNALINALLVEAQATEAALISLQASDPATARVVEAVVHGRLAEANITATLRSSGGAVLRGMGAVNQKIGELGRLLQNTKPVQGFDQRFEEMRQKVATKFPSMYQVLGRYGEFAKTHPKTQAFTIGVLTVMASLGTGPAGGAVAAMMLRASNELLKGEKASTAVGKASMAGVVGALAGLSINGLSQALEAKMLPMPNLEFIEWRGLPVVQYIYQRNGVVMASFNGIVTDEQRAKLDNAWRAFRRMRDTGTPQQVSHALFQLNLVIAETNSPAARTEMFTRLSDNKQAAQQAWEWHRSATSALEKVTQAMIAAVQGATAGADRTHSVAPTSKQRIEPSLDIPKSVAPSQPSRNPWQPKSKPTEKKRREPADPALWREVVRDMAQRFGRTPNAEAARWAMQTYKERGGSWA